MCVDFYPFISEPFSRSLTFLFQPVPHDWYNKGGISIIFVGYSKRVADVEAVARFLSR